MEEDRRRIRRGEGGREVVEGELLVCNLRKIGRRDVDGRLVLEGGVRDDESVVEFVGEV